MEVDQNSTNKVTSFVVKATNAPREFFENRDVAKHHFRRFGKVKLVMFKPKRSTLLVEYTTEDGMLNALELAGEHNGHFFAVSKEPAILKKKKSKKDPDPTWVLTDPDVKAELEAMGAYGASRTYELRSQAMNVDPEVSPKPQRQRAWRGSPKPPKKIVAKETASNEQTELANILKQQALTIEDKLRILDARDKLIRIKLKKNLELAKAKATIGVCPDMCPEKERLLREIQHQVALYEQGDFNKGLNPRLAIKQYSRSSADQEAPLPSELRPVDILQMTMGYLMHEIMNLCDTPDVNIGEWYHFLWDRTRGIRKDITQQELCCQGSVELVEQCARFHIFCSARLVAEYPSVFDQKINTENLTKCLQTLKYMYHDLHLKGESCKNEAEFRAYIILLNLNDGNFMWEVQQLKQDIQQSPQVKFALKVHSSLDKNNYVKFFKLVNNTTFLNSCILMRYFVQVRFSATKTLLKSYSPRISQTSLPVPHLTKILGFEDTEATIEFFEHYALYTDEDRTRIVLNRTNFVMPEYPYILDRAINLVESKRRYSVGQIVCGSALPPKTFENHIPLNSFDEQGYLKILPEIEEDFVRKEPLKALENDDVEEQPAAPQSLFTQSAKTSAKSIFGQSQADQAKSIFGTVSQKSIFAQRDEAERQKEKERLRMIEEEKARLQEEIRVKTEEKKRKRELEEKLKREEQERLRQEKEERLRQEEQRLKEEEERKMEHERKLRENAKKMQEEKRKEEERKIREERKRKRKEEERRSREIKISVCELLDDLVSCVEAEIKETKLKEILSRMKHRRMKRVIAKWRENTRRKRKRKALDFNPFWFGGRSLREEAAELRTRSQDLVLSNMKRYKRGKLDEVVFDEEEISRIDLAGLTYKLLRQKFLEMESKLQNELFWKVTISVPSETSGLNHLEKILDSYIKWEKRGATTVLVQQTKFIPTITYCLEKQKGFLTNSRHEANGFIFLAKDFNEDLSKRIAQNFENIGNLVKVPVVLILQECGQQQVLSEECISDYLVLVDKFTSKNLTSMMEEALIFLSTRVEKSPPLQMDTMKSFLSKHFSNVWKRANSFSKWNSNYKECLKNPNTVIYLHNEAVARLKAILLDQDCREFPKFPEIFKEFLRSEIPDSLPCDYKYFPNFWESAIYLQHLKNVVELFTFPNFLHNWPPKNQVELEASVSSYCGSLLKEPKKAFYKMMAVFLKNQDFANVIWTEALEMLLFEKLEEVDFSLYGTGFVNQSIYNQLVVVYDGNKLVEYNTSDWFYISNPVIRQKIMQLLQETQEEEVIVEESEEEEIDLDAILAKLTRPKTSVESAKSDLNSCRKMLADLEETVVIHKTILQRSGSLLKTIIEER